MQALAGLLCHLGKRLEANCCIHEVSQYEASSIRFPIQKLSCCGVQLVSVDACEVFQLAHHGFHGVDRCSRPSATCGAAPKKKPRQPLGGVDWAFGFSARNRRRNRPKFRARAPGLLARGLSSYHPPAPAPASLGLRAAPDTPSPAPHQLHRGLCTPACPR